MRRFNESWIAVAQAKANSLRNGRKKIVARFFPAYSKAKRLAHLLQFWSAIKTLGRRITWRSQENFDRHMLISRTRPNMEFGTGRVGVARRRARPLAGSQRAQLRKRYCRPFTRSWRWSLTSPRFMRSSRKSIVPL